MAALTLSTMLSACGGGGGGHGYLPPSIPGNNPDQPIVSCTGVTCMTNEGLSNETKRAELFAEATGGRSRMMRRATFSNEDPVDAAYTAMNEALIGWYKPDGSASLDTSDPNLRQNLILAGFENLPEDDEELKEWAAARQYLIKRHAEKAYKMYGKQNNDVRLDNVKLHLVEDTSNQDTFINFTLDNKKNINGIEILENDLTSEAVTDKINYKGGEKTSNNDIIHKFSSSDILHKYTFAFDELNNIYIFISESDLNGKEKPELAFIKEKLQLKLREAAAEGSAGGNDFMKNNLEKFSGLIDGLKDINNSALNHEEITRDFNVTYTSYAKDLKNGVDGGNLLYSDFGLLGTTLTQSDTVKPIEKTQVFAGGYDAAKINPTETMTFQGDAIAGINYQQAVTGDNGIIETKTLKLEDGKATLTFNNGTENLNVAFNNWYDVDVTKNLNTGQGSITFSGGDKIEDSNFKFKGIDKTAFAGDTGTENKFAVVPDYNANGHTSYTNSNFIGDVTHANGNFNDRNMQGFSGAMDIGYYGKDGVPSEATGYVMYGEDSLNGKQVQDIYTTDKAIQDFMDQNGIDNMTLEEFKKRNIIETVQMQLGVGMQKQ